MTASREGSESPPLPLLPTTVIGSYADPSWLWTALEEMRQGKYGETDITEIFGDAVRIAILDQEEAGVPHHEAMQAKIRELLERDGALSYSLSMVGVKRQE